MPDTRPHLPTPHRPDLTDAVALTQALVRCPSVTPDQAGALDLLQGWAEALSFTCYRLPFESEGSPRVDNLFARRGTAAPFFCYAGHVDVVPPGDAGAWRFPPFSATLAEGQVWGRGTADMKGSVAAAIAGIARLLQADPDPAGSIGLLITADEEGPSINGTVRVLEWMEANGHIPDACLVGEPTNPTRLGEQVKIGRRGSLSAEIAVEGVQGHVAYHDLADNPLPRLLATLTALDARVLDDGTADFPPSNLEIATVDTGNPAANVIPGAARATINIRFNDRHSGDSLRAWITETAAAHAGRHRLRFLPGNCEPFLTPPGPLSTLVAEAVEAETGLRPALTTTGGTSDARFIRRLCPVVEFGPIGATIHQTDERLPVDCLTALAAIYTRVLERFLAR